MLRHTAFCHDDRRAVWSIFMKALYAWNRRAFALISQGQRQSSNLGFQTLHAEQQRNIFMSKYCQYIYRQNFADTIHWQHCHIGWYISACWCIGQTLLLRSIYHIFYDISNRNQNTHICSIIGLFKSHIACFFERVATTLHTLLWEWITFTKDLNKNIMDIIEAFALAIII